MKAGRWLLGAGAILGGMLVIGAPLVRAFLVEPYRIPQAGMAPALNTGAFVLGWKQGGPPVHGDVMVFRYPEDPQVVFIKRVIAVGGETVEVRNNRPVVDGTPAPFEFVGVDEYLDQQCRSNRVKRFTTRTGDTPHDVFVSPGGGALANMDPITVPAGHYFVMGDNRDASLDSRAWGTVPPDLVLGVATPYWQGAHCP